jgi:hypothetical protein
MRIEPFGPVQARIAQDGLSLSVIPQSQYVLPFQSETALSESELNMISRESYSVKELEDFNFLHSAIIRTFQTRVGFAATPGVSFHRSKAAADVPSESKITVRVFACPRNST